MQESRVQVLAATIIAVGAVVALTIFGLFFYGTRVQRDTIQTVGAATQRFEADVVKWRITLGRQVPVDGLQEGYRRIAGDVRSFLDGLEAAGVGRNDVDVQPVSAFPTYDQTGTVTGYSLQQGLFLVSGEVDRVEELALDPGELLTGGTFLQSSILEYFNSRIDELKRELLASAAADARERAEEIAGSSEREIDEMVSARAGVFQITEPYSTEVSDFGVYNTSTRRKEIKVTVHATFRLE